MKIGLLGYLNNSGLGVMNRALIRRLGVQRHLVCDGGDKGNDPTPMAPETAYSPTWTPPAHLLREFLRGLDVVLTVETDYGTNLAAVAREAGVRSVMIPMWEWFPKNGYPGFNLYICTSKMTYREVDQELKVYVPWPVDMSLFHPRIVSGPAKTFLHCAGFGGIDYRKGTPEAVAGFVRANVPGTILIVRSQRPLGFYPPETISAIERHAIRFIHGNTPTLAELYSEGDAYLYTARLDGQAMVPMESMASGMPTFVTDAPPMNEYDVPPEFLLASGSMAPRSFHGRDVPVVACSVDDVARAVRWAASTEMGPHSGRALAYMQACYSWEALLPWWMEVLS